MEPLFSATPRIPRDPVPGESHHPSSFTGRIRRFLLNDGEALFTAQERQAEFHHNLDESDPLPRN
jgi:hypothetical protein